MSRGKYVPKIISERKNRKFNFKKQICHACYGHGICRCHLTDPEYVNKAMRGDTESIRKCIGCLYCFKVANQGKQIACTVNPRLGREFRYNEDTLKRDGDGRKVAVIGGGPAGMQAAITLAKRNFKPIIFEKEADLGGGVKVDRKLVEEFKNHCPILIIVGDAYAPGNIAKALKEANDKCYVF